MTREDLKPYCLSLVTTSRTFYLALKSDEELYSWMDEVYSRSSLMGVSSPTNFVHQVHVGFDPVSGAFTGLPEQWTRLLTSSAITKEDYAKNPQAVLDVLEFYTDIQKRERDEYGMGTTALGMTDVGDALGTRTNGPTTSARFGAGTGLAGQRSESSLDRFAAPSSHRSPPRTVAPSSSAYQSTAAVNRPLARSNGDSVNQSPHRTAPAPPSRQQSSPTLADSASTSSPYSASSDGTSRHPAPRSDLIPSRTAPPAPGAATSTQLPVAKDYSSAPRSHGGLKPLLTSSAARLATAQNSTTRQNVPMATSIGVKTQQPSSSAVSAGPRPAPPPPVIGQAASKGPLPVPKTAKAVDALKKGDRAEGDRRISSMSEAQIMNKLRTVCSADDPNTLYSKIKKVGQGASGSVYVAKVLSTGAKVAIKQMDLSHQPRKELIVNEILVMKESQHANIVNYLDSFLVKGVELWVVMEYMEGGALTDVIDSNTLEEHQISSICNEVRVNATAGPAQPSERLRLILAALLRLAKDCSTFTLKVSSIAISRATMYCSTLKVTSKLVSSRIRPCPLRKADWPFCKSRLWILCKADRSKVKEGYHGWHAVLDGTRSRQAEGVRRQGRHLVARHHGDRDD